MFDLMRKTDAFWKELPTLTAAGESGAAATPSKTEPPLWSSDRAVEDAVGAIEGNSQYIIPEGRLTRWASSCTSFLSAARKSVDLIILKPGKTSFAAVKCFDLTFVQTAAWPQSDGTLRINGPGLADVLSARTRWGPTALAELHSLPLRGAREWIRTLARGAKYAARGVTVTFEDWIDAFSAWPHSKEKVSPNTLRNNRRHPVTPLDIDAIQEAIEKGQQAARDLDAIVKAMKFDGVSNASERSALLGAAVALTLGSNDESERLVRGIPGTAFPATRTALLVLALRSKQNELAIELANSGAKPTADALAEALLSGAWPLAEALARAGASAAALVAKDPVTKELTTALGLVTLRLRRDAGATLVSALLAAGAWEYVSMSSNGRTPLYIATAASSPATVDILVRAGAMIPRGDAAEALLLAALGRSPLARSPAGGGGGGNATDAATSAAAPAAARDDDSTPPSAEVAEVETALRTSVVRTLVAAGVVPHISAGTLSADFTGPPTTALLLAASRGNIDAAVAILGAVPEPLRATYAAVRRADGLTALDIFRFKPNGRVDAPDRLAALGALSALDPLHKSVSALWPSTDNFEGIDANVAQKFTPAFGEDAGAKPAKAVSESDNVPPTESRENFPNAWIRDANRYAFLDKRERPVSLYVYSHRVLKQVHPEKGMSTLAGLLMDVLLSALFNSLVKDFRETGAGVTRPLLGTDVQNAIQRVFTRELARHASSEAAKALNKVNAAFAELSSRLAPATPTRHRKASKMSSAAYAGLQFPVGRVGAFLRRRLPHVTFGAAVAVAAALEYMTAEIMELSGNAARDNRKTRITPRFIWIAISNDEELSALLIKDVILFNRLTASRNKVALRGAVRFAAGLHLTCGDINRLLRSCGKASSGRVPQ